MKFLLLFTFVFFVFVSGANFNCAKATTKVERMICADAQLSQLDSDMGEAYKKVYQMLEEKNLLRDTQRMWLKERETCETSDCISKSTKERISEIESFMNQNAYISSNSNEKFDKQDYSYNTNKIPVEINIEARYNNIMNYYYPKIVIFSIVDNLVIEDVKINNGNCNFNNLEFKITEERGLNQKKLLPKKLNSYQEMEIDVNQNCRVRKIDIFTNKGQWSFTNSI
jgi:uncharacterized protein